MKSARSERAASTLQGTMEIDGNVWNLRRVGQGERLKEGLALQGSFKPTDRRTTSSLQAFKAQFMGSQGGGWPDGSTKWSSGALEGIWEAIGERKGSYGVLHLQTYLNEARVLTFNLQFHFFIFFNYNLFLL